MKRWWSCVAAVLLLTGVGYGQRAQRVSATSADVAAEVVPPPVPDVELNQDPTLYAGAGDQGGGPRDVLVVPGAEPNGVSTNGAGTDGALNVTDNLVINLASAPTGTWNSDGGDVTGDGVADGVYDPDKWAVVFKYSSVNVASAKSVTFLNHPSGAPVVWLVQGNVTIAGTVALNGGAATGSAARPATAGPGGFRGGRARQGAAGSGGFGPGGGQYADHGGSGSYGGFGSAGSNPTYAPLYGNAGVFPLIGGSGGAGRGDDDNSGGGAGGGAIMIACPSTIGLTGQLQAIGGSYDGYGGAGSGGAIRLIANQLAGIGSDTSSGKLYAYGGYSTYGVGRIRVEANEITLQHLGNPAYSQGSPGAVARLWPEDLAPRVRVVSLGGQDVPTEPLSRLNYPSQDLTFNTSAPVTVVIGAENVPVDPPSARWTVKVRVVPTSGTDFTVAATYVGGDNASSTWNAQLTLPNGFCAIQVRAAKP